MKLIFLVFFCIFLIKVVKPQSLIENNAKYACGVRKVQPTEHFESQDGSWPWQVAIIDQTEKESTSGTLISAYYVITSKKGITNSSHLFIIAGGANLFSFLIPTRVNKVVLHPDPNNDLAILELDQPLQFSDYILPICLPSSNFSKIFGLNLTLTGWADLEGIGTDNQLLETRVKVVNQLECESEPNLYCTLDVTQDLCFNDYGSGLYYSENGVWYLYGVNTNNSDVLLCNVSMTKKIYHTMVPKFLDWITKSLEKTEPDHIPFVTNPPDNFCGKPEIEPMARIVKGIPSIPNSWPWTVGIWTQQIGQISFDCGGTIISNRYILTAGHCVPNKKKKYFVSVGTKSLTYAENLKNMHLVKHVILNGYDNMTLKNDIALLKLVKPIKFNRRVSRVCLPLSSDVTEVFNKTLYVAGWGATNKEDISNQQLQTKLKVINFNNSTLCRSRDWLEYCALDQERDSNVCHGDSGSGLVYFKNKRWHIYGLVSHGISFFGYCINTSPSHHTMVPKYLDWIQRAMKANFNDNQYFIDFD